MAYIYRFFLKVATRLYYQKGAATVYKDLSVFGVTLNVDEEKRDTSTEDIKTHCIKSHRRLK